jgi:hypothetical protein
MIDLFDEFINITKKHEEQCSPKIRFKCYKTFYLDKNNNINARTEMRLLRRESCIYGWIDDFFLNIDAEALQAMFTGRELKHGCVYEVVIINEQKDYETGVVDDWDYDFKLVEEKQCK